jgi:hypothetical protein
VVYGCVRCPGDARIGCRICSVFLLCLCGGKQGQQQSMRRDTHDHGGYALFGSENKQPVMEQGGEELEKNGELTQGSWTCSEMAGTSPGRNTATATAMCTATPV